MKYIEIVADVGSTDTVMAIADKIEAQDFRQGVVGEDGMQQMRMIVSDSALQQALDTLQNVLGTQPSSRIVVMPIEIILPKLDKDKKTKEESATATRESLYAEVEKGTRLDFNYMLLVMLSTILAAIGLIENNIAVVIGAMVIAPLLGPNLALSLGTALGDVDLMRKSTISLVVGILIAIGMSMILGIV